MGMFHRTLVITVQSLWPKSTVARIFASKHTKAERMKIDTHQTKKLAGNITQQDI